MVTIVALAKVCTLPNGLYVCMYVFVFANRKVTKQRCVLPRLKLFCAKAVCDIFYRVAEAVGVIVCWVYAPLITRTMMREVFDSICYRI